MSKITWSGAHDTNWFNPNNWRPALVPGSGDTIVIPSGLMNYPVVPNGQTLMITQPLTDEGVIAFNSTGSNTDLIFNGGTTVTVTGGGVIALSDSSANRIYSNQGGTTLDNSDTIAGAGQIFSNGNLGIVNEAAGVIDGSAVNNQLNINSIWIGNSGLVESTGAGGLGLHGMTLDQSGGGTLEAAGGNVWFDGSHVIGGTLTTSGTSLIETDGGGTWLDGTGTLPVTITAGSAVQVNDGQNLTITGTIANSGTIRLASGQDGVHFDNTDLIVNGGGTPLALQGGGTIAMSDSSANRIYSNQGGTTLDNSDTIAGAGQIFSNGNLGIVNEAAGVIDASAANNQLNIYSIGVANNGLVESTSTGSLGLHGMTLDQSGGGTLLASGGNVWFSNNTILGGFLTTAGTSLIETDGNNGWLNGSGTLPVTITTGSTVRITDGTNLNIVGTITNNGTIDLDSGEDGVHYDNTDLLVEGSGTVTLNGGGTIAMSDSPYNRIYSNNSNTILDNINNTITGAGQIWANGNLEVINEAKGVINASAANNQLNIHDIYVANNGLVESTSTGSLGLHGMTLDQSGGGTLLASGGNVWFSNNTILGGFLTTAGTSLIETDGNNGWLNGSGTLPVTITTGSTVRITDGTNLNIVGTITNNGTIDLDSGEDGVHYDNTDLLVEGSGTVTLNGGGTIAMSDSPYNRIYSNNSNTILDNINNTITGAGQIWANNNLEVINEVKGVIDASAANNQLNIYSIGVTNNGLVESTSTGSLGLHGMTLDQSGGGTLKAAGGNVWFNGSRIYEGMLTTSGTSLIETDGNNATLDGTGSNALTISAGSTVQINDGTNLTLVGTITNNGTIDLNSGEDGVHYDNTDLLVEGSGTVTLNGGGTIAMSNSPYNRIYSNNSNTILDNIDNTITGAGQIWANGNLEVINEAKGVINASAANNQLNIHDIYVANNGLVESTSTGSLGLHGMTLDQSGGGTLLASGGNVWFSNNTILGGFLTTAGTSLIETDGNNGWLNGSGTLPVTITTGSTVRITDGTNLNIVGTITNNGTIDLDSGEDGVHYDNTDLLVEGSGTVTLNGGGTIAMSDSPYNRIYSNNSNTILDNINNTITGAGQIWANGNLEVINEAKGVINASAANNQLNIHDIYVANNGLVESTSTGSLGLHGMTLDQSGGGTLKAAGGNVWFNGSRIYEGTLTTSGTSLIETDGNNATLDGTGSNALTISAGSTVQINDGTNLTLVGTISDVGTISLNSTGDNTDLLIAGGGTVTLTGGGAIAMSASGANRIYSTNGGTTLDNVNDKISGAGQIFSNGNLGLINEAAGVINANQYAAGLNIHDIGVTNKGQMAATSFGGLWINNATITQSGAGVIKAAGGNVYVNNSHIVGGALSTAGPFLIETSGNSTYLDGNGALAVTLTAGSTFQVNDGTNLTIGGAIGGPGAIRLNSTGDNTDLLVSTTTLKSGATILLGGNYNNRIYSNWGGSVLDNVGGLIEGGGRIYANGNLSLTNEAGGTIEALQGEALYVQMGLANAGTLEANGGRLEISGGVGAVGGVSGTGVVANGGTLVFDSSSVSLAAMTYLGPDAGAINLSYGTTPTITGFAYGDSFTVSGYSSYHYSLSEQFVENSGGTSGVLTISYWSASGGLGAWVPFESFTLNGSYTTQSFLLQGDGVSFTISDAGNVWNGSTDAWNTPADWSSGAVPVATDDVAINSGAPAVTASIGKIRTLSIGAGGTVDFNGATGNTVSGAVYNSGLFELDGVSGQGGSAVLAGSVANAGGATLDVGNATLSAADTLTTGSLQNFGSILVAGSAANQALINVTGVAGFGAAGSVTGSVSLAGKSAIEFASGQITTVAAGGSLTLSGASAFVEDAGALGSQSALKTLVNVNGALHLENGATLAPTGTVYDVGSINLDDASGAGGSKMTVSALTNLGALTIGNATLSASDQFNTAALNNPNGATISLIGAGTNQALLDVTSGAAGFGIAGTLTGAVSLAGNSVIEFPVAKIATIASGASLKLVGNQAFVADATSLTSNSALSGLATVAGSLSLDSGASVVSTVALADGGSIVLDGLAGEGGSKLSMTTMLTNTGALALGNSTLSSADSITAAGLGNSGAITLSGGASTQALLSVTAGAAGFGTIGVLTGAVSMSGSSAIKFVSGTISTIASGASLAMSGSKAYIEDGATNTNSALSGLATVSGALFLDNSVTIASTSALTNANTVTIDGVSGEGGSKLSTTQTLTNTGTLSLGNATLSSADFVTAAALANTGSINLIGGASIQALLNVTGGTAGFGAAGILTGAVSMSGSSAIKFVSGTISTIASGASLAMSGSKAYIEDGATNTNSALTGLATVSGSLTLDNGPSIASTVALTDASTVTLDGVAGEGGSKLSTTQTLTNTGTLSLGNATLSSADLITAASLANAGTITLAGGATNQALLHVTTGTAGFGTGGILTGAVTLSGDSAIEFPTGSIATIATGSSLRLIGNQAYIEDGASNTDSALTGLAAIAGSLTLDSSAPVASTAAIANSGTTILDGVGGEGGSSLSTAGTLTNSGTLALGNGSLSANDTIQAAAIRNTGSISLTGSGANQALLHVTTGSATFSATAGTVTGSVILSGDSAVEFATGSIGTIAAGATLRLRAANATIEDAAALGTNSALSLLTNVAGAFLLDNGAAVASTNGIANSGSITLDGPTGEGGSRLSTTGTLTNSGTLSLGNAGLSSADTIAASAVNNTGAITLTGSGSLQALLNVSGAAAFGAPGRVIGSVILNGDSAVEFGSGSITTIALAATLRLGASDAWLEDASSLGSNSALSLLSTVNGVFDLDNGASVRTTSLLTIGANGGVFVDGNSGEYGSSLTTAELVNAGTLNVGNTGSGGVAVVSTAALNNTSTGAIDLSGGGQMSVSGSVVNNGAIYGIASHEYLAGAVSGTGTIDLYNDATMTFGGSVGSGQTVTDDGPASILIGQATQFHAEIAGFGTNDAMDATAFTLLSGWTYGYTDNGHGTGGVLSVTSGGQTMNLNLVGSYSTASFSVGQDASKNGTLITYA